MSSNINSRVLDASDKLNRSREILEYVIDRHSKDREQSPGLGWILDEVQTGIVDAMALLNSAVAASADDQTVTRRDAFYAARQGVAE